MRVCVAAEMAPESPHARVIITAYRTLIEISVILLLLLLVGIVISRSTVIMVTARVFMEILFKVTLLVASIQSVGLWVSRGTVAVAGLVVQAVVVVATSGVVMVLLEQRTTVRLDPCDVGERLTAVGTHVPLHQVLIVR